MKLRSWFHDWKRRRAQRKLAFPAMIWKRQGAILVPTAEFQGIDIDDDQKEEWVRQFQPPPAPKPRYPLPPAMGSIHGNRDWEH